MEDEQDSKSSDKHQKTKQKWKASATALQKSGKSKSSKASKDKSALAQSKQDLSESQEVVAKARSQPDEDDHRANREHKNKFMKATLKLIQMTVEERDIQEAEQENEATNSPRDEEASDAQCSTDDAVADDELLAATDREQRNMPLLEKLAYYSQSDVFGAMDLSSLNIIDDDIPVIFARVFRKGKRKYANLVLRDNALTSAGVKILVDQLLKTPTSLRNIGLSSNPDIGDAGVEHLVRLLQKSRSITILALHHTGVTDQGVRLLADALCNINTNSLSSLEKLYISFNKSITDESLDALTQILEQNQTLKVLALQHCSLSEKARRRLRQTYAKKKKRKLSLSE